MNLNFSKYINANTIRLVIFFVILAVATNALEEMVDDVFLDPIEGDHEYQQFDSKVFDYVRQIESDKITEIMRDLTSLGSISVVTILALFCGLMLLIYRRFRDFTYLLIVTGVTPLLVSSLKLYFNRDRPPETTWLLEYMPGLSFPSGHAFTSAAIYLAIAYIFTIQIKRWPFEVLIYAIMFIIIFMVGVSRIYLGVHYPTDVIAGIASGTIWVMLVSMGFEYYRKVN